MMDWEAECELDYWKHLTLEELYQEFKKRLLEEIEVIGGERFGYHLNDNTAWRRNENPSR